MANITGYLTVPNQEHKEFCQKVEKLQENGLETRLFESMFRRGKLFGPNGVLMSGEADLNSSDVMKIMYGNDTPENMPRLTYDISSTKGGEDFEVRMLSLGDFDAYFALRVVREMDKVVSFNRGYLSDSPDVGFRFVEPGYVAYETLTYREELDRELEEAKRLLKTGNMKLDEKETTTIRGLYNF